MRAEDSSPCVRKTHVVGMGVMWVCALAAQLLSSFWASDIGHFNVSGIYRAPRFTRGIIDDSWYKRWSNRPSQRRHAKWWPGEAGVFENCSEPETVCSDSAREQVSI